MPETYKLQFTESEMIVVSVVFSVNATMQLLFKILVFRLVYKRGPLSQVWPQISHDQVLENPKIILKTYYRKFQKVLENPNFAKKSKMS